MSQEIRKLIEETIIHTWNNEIKDDYESGWLLKEDTLKNAFYYHLRTKLGAFLEANDIRIFTEFHDWKFIHSGVIPDIVIAKVNFEKDCSYWGEAVTECLAVLELKFKSGFTPSRDIYKDYEKLKSYKDDLGVDCKMYMATIWEYEDDETAWLSDEPDWAKGLVTELNASYKRGTTNMRFYAWPH